MGKDHIEASYSYGVYDVRIKKGEVDTVSVHKQDQLITTFLAQYGAILSPYISYLVDDVRYTDSLDLNGKARKVKYDYYGGFASNRLFTTYNHSNGDQVYYAIYGADSLYVNRYNNGQVQKMVWLNYGTEYARKQWSPEGKLQYEKYGSRETTYEPAGQLHSQRYDTLMAGRTVHCKKAWHDNGTPDSVAYYYRGKPCHIWSYYNQSGQLIRTVKKTALNKLQEEVPEPPTSYGIEEPMILRTVSVEEMYKGDFITFFHTEMNNIRCNSPKALRGIYTLRTAINIEGKMSFVSATGENIEAIIPALQQMINKMGTWKPTQENRRSMASVLEFRFHIIDTD